MNALFLVLLRRLCQVFALVPGAVSVGAAVVACICGGMPELAESDSSDESTMLEGKDLVLAADIIAFA